MKILKIEFKNINSLQGEHEIDFRNAPFFGNNLFAITGPTGSGKSSILDILVLALFNRTPRYSQISKNEIQNNGAILTRGQKDAFARVTYECQKGEFVSEWMISTNTRGNLNDYSMDVYDVLTKTSLVSRKSEVPKKNESLIGLTYDQFVKSVMLAQGDFAEFLTSKKADRTDLLEKITGTEIYRKIGIKVYEKFKNINETLNHYRQQKENWQREILEEEKFKEILENRQIIENELKELKAQEKILQQQIEHKNQLTSAENSLKLWTEKEQKIGIELKEFEENQGIQLNQHKKVEPIQKELIQWKRYQEDQQKNKEKERKNKEKSDEIILSKQSFKNKIQQLLKKDIDENEYELELNNFEKKVLSFIQKSEKQIQEGSALKNEISFHISGLNLSFEKNNYQNIYKSLVEKQESATKFIEAHQKDNKDRSALELEIQDLNTKLEISQKAKTDAIQLENLQKEIRQLEQEKLNISTLIKDLPEEIRNQKEKIKTQNIHLENLLLKSENQKLISTLEEHRNHLKSGEACPLCGALEHPYATDIPMVDENELSKVIKQKSKELDSLKQLLNTNETTLRIKSESLNQHEEKLLLSTENLRKLEIQFQENYGDNLKQDWDQLQENLKQKIEILRNLIQSKTELEITQNAIPKMDQMFDLLNLAQKTKAELKEIYDDVVPVEDKVDLLQNEWFQILSEQKIIQHQSNEINEEKKHIEKSIEDLQSYIDQKIHDFGIENIETAISYLLDYEELQKLTKTFEDLKTNLSEIKIHKENFAHTLNELIAKDVAESLENLNNRLTSMTEIQLQKNEVLDDYKRKIQNQKEFQEKIETLNEKIKNETKSSQHWLALNTMIGDARGAKFNNFAQDLTLLQLLHLANQRLKTLNKRYVIDISKDNEDDNLVVIDEEMGGQRRSVKTLSGGETFVLSLALALALSDLASNKVQIKSLFIDEGFGTLDPETLDQTLTTLEQLQEEGSKMIGIISHVSTLKERISAQIQIVPGGRGFSSLKILP